MAPLWALTGETESRGDVGKLTLSDVLCDGAKSARVLLEGTVNGAPFRRALAPAP